VVAIVESWFRLIRQGLCLGGSGGGGCGGLDMTPCSDLILVTIVAAVAATKGSIDIMRSELETEESRSVVDPVSFKLPHPSFSLS
jgi:hypothetical protein